MRRAPELRRDRLDNRAFLQNRHHRIARAGIQPPVAQAVPSADRWSFTSPNERGSAAAGFRRAASAPVKD